MDRANKSLLIFAFKIFIFSQIFILAVFSGLALASKSGRELEATKRKAAQLQDNLDATASKYQKAYSDYLRTKEQLNKTNQEISVTKKRLSHRQGVFSLRLSKTYKYGSVGILEVIFESNSFSEMINRFDMLQIIAEQDAELLKEIKKDKAILETQQKRLDEKTAKERVISKKLKQESQKLSGELSRQQELISKLKDKIKKEELARLEAARARRVATARASVYKSSRGGSSSLKLTRGFVFPVAGPHAFTNDWGNPRSEGRRHKGTDIFARKHTPCVAVVSGSVVFRSGGRGGLTARLRGDDGNTYYYAHLSGYGQGGRVSAGTVIGYVGSSGNASGTSPHLHFEIWPGGGGAINPYPILSAAR